MFDITCNNATASSTFTCTASQSSDLTFKPSTELGTALTIFFLIVIVMAGIILGASYIRR